MGRWSTLTIVLIFLSIGSIIFSFVFDWGFPFFFLFLPPVLFGSGFSKKQQNWENQLRYCRNCGYQLLPMWRYCPNCNYEVRKEE